MPVTNHAVGTAKDTVSRTQLNQTATPPDALNVIGIKAHAAIKVVIIRILLFQAVYLS